MKKLSLLLLLIVMLCMTLQVQARSFRSIQPIATPTALPEGATRMTISQPIERSLVEQAVRDVATAWNGGGLSELLADDFSSRSRLLDTIAEVVPRDARLTVLAIQAVSTLEQYRQDKVITSTVSAVVRSQIEFNDPVTGFQRLEGTGEWYFKVEEADSSTPSSFAHEEMKLFLDQEKQLQFSGADAISITPGSFGEWERMEEQESPETMPDDPMTVTGRVPSHIYIERVDPPSRRWNSNMTIIGRNFGSQGQVALFVPHNARSLVIDELAWSRNAINIRIGDLSMLILEDLPYREPVTAEVWVCPDLDRPPSFPEDIGSCGGRKEISIQPLVEAVTPVITEAISSIPSTAALPRLGPGQAIQLLGYGFGAVSGSAVFHIGDRDYPAGISSWSEEEINLVMPDSISGLVEQEATLTITNHLGLDADTVITFVPRIDIKYFTATVSIDGIFGYARCRRMGDALNFHLINDWEVTGTIDASQLVTRASTLYPDMSGDPDFSDVEIELSSRPFPAGPTIPRIGFSCIAKWDSQGQCAVRVQVRGPVGTHPAMHATETAPVFPKKCQVMFGDGTWVSVDDE